jgi:MYXO-CTERM domain-containing protein
MRSHIERVCWHVLALAVLVHAAGVNLYASLPPAVAPEIDGGSVSAALGLLAAGVLMLRARRSSKRPK